MQLYLDIGSTNIKYGTSLSNEIDSVSFPMPIKNQYPYYEVDVDELIGIIKNIISSIKPDELYISTQMHGYVLLRNGKKVTNYISWRDERGHDLKPNFVISEEYGVNIKNNLPRLSIQSQDVEFDEFASLGSYIAYILTGKNESHITDLAASGFYNITKQKADNVSFKLPVAHYKETVVGTYGGVKVYSPFGDQQSSVYGIPDYLNKDCSLILNVGTASQICFISKDFIKGKYESRPYFDNKYLLTVTRLPGGAFIYGKKDDELFDDLYETYKKTIASLPTCEQIIVTGGGSRDKKDLFNSIFKKLGIKCIFNENIDAINGLRLLAKKEKNMNKVGLMISEIPHHSMPLILKQAGLDFCILDYEHGGFDYESIARIVLTSKLSNFTTIVRLPNNERKDIIKILDMGADGLLLPMTNNVEDAKKLVNYAKYPPMGKRGISTMRAHTLYNPGSIMEYTKSANERIKVYAQIETIDGVNNIEEIINLEGIAGVMVGPNDLSADYGCLADKNAPQILEAIEKVGKAAKNANKECAIITGNKNYLDCAKVNGFNTFCIGSELNALTEYAKRIKKENE